MLPNSSNSLNSHPCSLTQGQKAETWHSPKMQQHDHFCPTFYNPFEVKHRKRTSTAQLKVLEKSFWNNPKPKTSVRRMLAQNLDMTSRGVQTWFQNRRAKAKLERRRAEAEAEAEAVPGPMRHRQHCQQKNKSNASITTTATFARTSPMSSYHPNPNMLPPYSSVPSPTISLPLHKREDLCYFNTMDHTQSAVWPTAPPTASMVELVEPTCWIQQDTRRHSCLEKPSACVQPEDERLTQYYYMTAAAAAAMITANVGGGGGVLPPRRQSEGDVQRFNVDFAIDDFRLDYSSASTVSVAGSPISQDYPSTTNSAAQDSLFLLRDLY